MSRIREPWYSWLIAAKNAKALVSKPERPIELGPLNPDRTIYVINDLRRGVGLAGWVERVVGYMIFAKRNGWTPVVMMPDDEQRDDRGWYEYFESVSDVSPEDAMKSKRVVFATTRHVTYARYNSKSIARRHDILESVRMNGETAAFVQNALKEHFEQTRLPRIGIYFRGTDYRKAEGWCASGHPSVPTFEQFFRAVDQHLLQWAGDGNCGCRMFIVTEEEEALDAILQRYPEAHYVKKPRFANFKFGECISRQTPAGLDEIENNRLYLADLYALASCDYLIGPLSGGMQLALNLNGNAYKGVDILDFGTN